MFVNKDFLTCLLLGCRLYLPANRKPGLKLYINTWVFNIKIPLSHICIRFCDALLCCCYIIVIRNFIRFIDPYYLWSVHWLYGAIVWFLFITFAVLSIANNMNYVCLANLVGPVVTSENKTPQYSLRVSLGRSLSGYFAITWLVSLFRKLSLLSFKTTMPVLCDHWLSLLNPRVVTIACK